MEHFLLALISKRVEMQEATQSASVKFTVGFETAMNTTSILTFKQNPPSPTTQSTAYARRMSGCMCLHCRRTPSGLGLDLHTMHDTCENIHRQLPSGLHQVLQMLRCMR